MGWWQFLERVFKIDKEVNRYILLFIVLFCAYELNGQVFYANSIDYNANGTNKTIQLNISNCSVAEIFTCPTTNNAPYYDIAIDSSQNIFYVGADRGLYKRELNNISSCSYLGNFESGIYYINSLVSDVNGDIYACGGNVLYKYESQTHIFRTLGNLPPDIYSLGDLFFYEGRLFLIALNSAASAQFLVEINTVSPGLSFIYMNLPNLNSYAGFSLKFPTYSQAYIVSKNNDGSSTLFEIDMSQKILGPSICTYSFEIDGCASIYNFSTNVPSSNFTPSSKVTTE